ncbi:bifunctional 23S rRNA (guanine(2069)-N(7))-methyltransferase RlmK/23S rRNA (guanine(2445)-N(2))-methyltransferase RlmL [Amphritea pacifica]|uniref:Ribosomal RNA large subunit methyltransferase K/L n=1 Tax=Amphritea pacifica TaxID=2811233 RepID=A0ABS2W4Y4_9GAMM|nr:bifunctional 23S rRNA (guanine(2069)-N(7))-methyltransferase RlmK/23S rRNA (guanine(2445)-N(2))-methyltransferase RlmL [Amphritea pacifica]MBN0986655.1 bifunctional 23S rRNA (guanine(2069)-N(7))-methyltransferase RlmK/23S rRNA (guanine(2445)-N(2))-methyltransferase RlmL [Amphritea pacifica]MBN1007247.1 bifunctional 23S rRNA (guanine(2069)-N(7))-methyltransferase RlmK/23S rRNA (guanine(2445)-N(2))-methyltransferase RlmL [Amphritea pacifica]
MKFFATCPKGLEPVLFDELQALNVDAPKQTLAGVYFSGGLEAAYRACLWSRVANRILLELQRCPAETADQLYQGVQQLKWLEHMRPEGTLTIDFTGQSEGINHSRFGAQKVKDAIVDQIRDETGRRPSVDRLKPDLRVNVHLQRGEATIAVDISGDSLHRRGYRLQSGSAPMKENLAAALLYRCGWPEKAAQGQALLDPMCGSGTLLIEGVLMAADIAPGLLRRDYGFTYWTQHNSSLWKSLVEEAQQRREAGLKVVSSRFEGFDADAKVLNIARDNARRAGVEGLIHLERRELSRLSHPATDAQGLVVTNPPYGERLGDEPTLFFLYQHLGERLKAEFAGWQAAVFTGNPELCRMMKLAADKTYKLYNGAIPSQLQIFNIRARQEAELAESEGLMEGQPDNREPAVADAAPVELSDGAQMLANRLRKNFKQLGKWARRQEITCYRLYDADLPEYSAAIDIYDDWVHVQEYQAPKSVDVVKAFARLQEIVAVLPSVLGVPAAHVVLKQRRRQQGSSQYEKQDQTAHFIDITEGGCRILVNLEDYLDTGLFLDHRPVRMQIQQEAKGKDFLNLFCYTATASLHAAQGGARSTTSIDMSATYLNWAKKNFALNGFSEARNHFIQEDCIRWLKAQKGEGYDLIFLDPPTFSNSKRMHDVLDVQRDHVELISLAMGLLRPEGKLIFSNNYRRFKIDPQLAERYRVVDITRKSIDLDFKRSSKIHQCFEISAL